MISRSSARTRAIPAIRCRGPSAAVSRTSRRPSPTRATRLPARSRRASRGPAAQPLLRRDDVTLRFADDVPEGTTLLVRMESGARHQLLGSADEVLDEFTATGDSFQLELEPGVNTIYYTQSNQIDGAVQHRRLLVSERVPEHRRLSDSRRRGERARWSEMSSALMVWTPASSDRWQRGRQHPASRSGKLRGAAERIRLGAARHRRRRTG